MLRDLAGCPYEDEGVDKLEHALQTAAQARACDAAPDVVAAALLHDIGRAPGLPTRFTAPSHEAAAEKFCRPHCGERAAFLVGQHVAAKRYLVATDEQYARSLSPASQRSLQRQGGPMTGAEISAFRSRRWAAQAVQLRRWDDAAKVPHACIDPLNSYRREPELAWAHGSSPQK